LEWTSTVADKIISIIGPRRAHYDCGRPQQPKLCVREHPTRFGWRQGVNRQGVGLAQKVLTHGGAAYTEREFGALRQAWVVEHDPSAEGGRLRREGGGDAAEPTMLEASPDRIDGADRDLHIIS
jgi:hypothetical protein